MCLSAINLNRVICADQCGDAGWLTPLDNERAISGGTFLGPPQHVLNSAQDSITQPTNHQCILNTIALNVPLNISPSVALLSPPISMDFLYKASNAANLNLDILRESHHVAEPAFLNRHVQDAQTHVPRSSTTLTIGNIVLCRSPSRS
jgi:hypothetical protein